LEAGREGRCFTYTNCGALDLGVGDLVRVRLQGRPHTGLVVAIADTCPVALQGRALLPVEAVLQSAAVDPHWQALLEAVARQGHTSLFRTLKSALPPGWLGQGPRPAGQGRTIWTVRLPAPRYPEGIPSEALGPRQRALVEHLTRQGGQRLLRELVQVDGFGRALIATMVEREVATKFPAKVRRFERKPRSWPLSLSSEPGGYTVESGSR